MNNLNLKDGLIRELKETYKMLVTAYPYKSKQLKIEFNEDLKQIHEDFS